MSETDIVLNDNYTKNIKNIIENEIAQTRRREIQAENSKLYTYWNALREIVKAQNEDKIKYGNSYVRELGFELTRLYGKGYDYTNLTRMKKLYMPFSKVGILSPLFITWSHFVVIISIKDENKRNYYVNLVNENKLSVTKLKEKIQKQKSNVFQKSISNSKVTKFHVSSNVLNDINDLLEKKYDTSQSIKLRDYTPRQLVEYGVKDFPMLENANHVLSNILTEEEAKKYNQYNKNWNYHGLGVKLYLEVVGGLDDPVAIYQNKNGKDYIILTNQVNSNGEKIIVLIYIETKGNYNNIEIKTNKIKSVYGKNNLEKYITRNLKNGTIKKIYNKNQVNTTESQSFNDINLKSINNISNSN